MAELTPSGLLDNPSYMSATCGMHKSLLSRLRPVAAKSVELQALCQALADNATAKLDATAAIIVAPPIGPPTCVATGGTGDPREAPDVVIWLMLDPLDIDSKQMTFCGGRKAQTYMTMLYKWSGGARPPIRTELPRQVEEESDEEQSEESAAATEPVQSSAAPVQVQRFVVQESWDDDEDEELRAHLAASGVPTSYVSTDEILQMVPSAQTMVFADTAIVQQLLGGRGVVDTYPSSLQPLYKRGVKAGRLSELQPALPYFVKATGSDKAFAARVVRTPEEASDCTTAVGDRQVYVCDVLEFVSEHRLFLSPGRVWGVAEYSEYMIGHRLQNAKDSSEPLVVEDAAVPPPFVDEVLRCAADLGFVVVDVGLTRQGEWCVVEANPPFALSSYDLDIGVYVEYCAAAWQHIVASLEGDRTA